MYTFKKVRNGVILYTLLISVGVAAYYLLLTEEARKSLRNAGSAVSSSYQKMSNVISDAQGIIMEDDIDHLPNRESILEQWKNLGF